MMKQWEGQVAVLPDALAPVVASEQAALQKPTGARYD